MSAALTTKAVCASCRVSEDVPHRDECHLRGKFWAGGFDPQRFACRIEHQHAFPLLHGKPDGLWIAGCFISDPDDLDRFAVFLTSKANELRAIAMEN